MRRWRISGLQMFENVWGLLCRKGVRVGIQLSESRIRPSPDVPFTTAFALVTSSNGAVLPTKRRPEGETSGALSAPSTCAIVAFDILEYGVRQLLRKQTGCT